MRYEDEVDVFKCNFFHKASNMEILNEIKCLAGVERPVIFPMRAFSDEIIDFLNELSERIRRNEVLRRNEEAAAFGFWCRKSHLLDMKKKYDNEENKIGLGLIFHIAPSNISTVFAYSFAIGLLSGNANVVRISKRNSDTAMEICGLLQELFRNPKYENIKKRTSIITYEKNKSITDGYSDLCNGRVIWGGDKAINEIRKSSLKLMAKEIIFPNRYSLCILNTLYILNMEKEELEILAHKFYNDTYNMDQNACSSPKIIFWSGGNSKEKREAQNKWWKFVYKEASKLYNLSENKVSLKYSTLCECAINCEEIQRVKRYDNLLYVVDLKEVPANIESLNGRFGLFFQYELINIKEIESYVNERIQTLTYAGFDKNYLINFVIENHLKGIDRIVPIGQALDMNVMWDGMNLIERLSRSIM